MTWSWGMPKTLGVSTGNRSILGSVVMPHNCTGAPKEERCPKSVGYP